MASVPQKTLDWLCRVLTNQSDPNQAYHDPNRTYSDVANSLAQYHTLSPRTDVYTYEDGVSALLLQITGTLPVTFRGTIYRFPITLWVPNTYPREPPIVYVTPTRDMLVRPAQHVSGEGRVYHHYLAHWAEAWDRSTIVDLLSILQSVFAKEPPVISKQQQTRGPPASQPQPAPPALPPLPPELLSPVGGSAPVPVTKQEQVAPELPPKLDQARNMEGPREPLPQERHQRPPPLPPLPDGFQETRRGSYRQLSNNRGPYPLEEQYGNLVLPATSAGQLQERHGLSSHVYQKELYQQAPRGSLSPVSPTATPMLSQFQQALGYQSHQEPSTSSSLPRPPYWNPPLPHRHPPAVNRLHGDPSQQQQQQQEQEQQQQQQQQQNPPNPVLFQHETPSKKTETPDLLTSPFELEFPTPATLGIAPPIPPNPEKDALLRTLSRALTQTLQSNISQADSALQPLRSQSTALHAALSTLQSEISALNTLQATLQSNISILQHSLHRADSVIADAQTRISSPAPSRPSAAEAPAAVASTSGHRGTSLPRIDDVVVAPTVVGKQLYDLVADERGIQQAIYALQAGLVRGRVGVETWARLTRGLAREAFLKRALVRKAATGMGLVLEEDLCRY